MDSIITERSDGLLRVELNRPEKLNAVTSEMYLKLADIFAAATREQDIRAVLWHGAGDNFSAGNDVKDFLEHPPGAGESPQSRLMNALLDLDKPLVAAVRGAAVGGGTTMLLHCDFVYAGESTRFQTPFGNLGLVPEFGSSFLLPRASGHIRAAELLLLGLPFDAKRAAELGLVTQVVPDRDLMRVATDAARALAAKPSGALLAAKRLLKQDWRGQVKAAMKAENEAFSIQVRSGEAKEALSAFLEKRAPDFTKIKKLAPIDAEAKGKPMTNATGRLFVLELSGGRIHAMNPDGSDKKVIVADCHLPDGIVVDVEAGYIYWTNMGVPNLNDGSIERADLDGGNRTVIVPQGITFTPKQLHLEKRSGKLYWCDREGMRVMRANLDGSNVETLVKTGEGEKDRKDATRWCVGITVDPKRGQIYWTQKGSDNSGLGRIFRAGIDLPKGEDPARRSDIEIWLGNLPEPIDLELDLGTRTLYWTDRGNPPSGNTVNRAPVDAPGQGRKAEIVVGDLMEGIGIALDVPGNRMFVTDLGGSLYTARLNGGEKRVLLFAQGNLSGIAFAEIPRKEH